MLEETYSGPKPTIRKVEKEIIIGRTLPRIRIWTPFSFTEALEDIAKTDASVLKIFQPSQSKFSLPDRRIHLITDVKSNIEITGFDGQFFGDSDAEFILYLGSLKQSYYSRPAEMRFAFLQTALPKSTIDIGMKQARRKLAALNLPSGVPRFLDGEY